MTEPPPNEDEAPLVIAGEAAGDFPPMIYPQPDAAVTLVAAAAADEQWQSALDDQVAAAALVDTEFSGGPLIYPETDARQVRFVDARTPAERQQLFERLAGVPADAHTAPLLYPERRESAGAFGKTLLPEQTPAERVMEQWGESKADVSVPPMIFTNRGAVETLVPPSSPASGAFYRPADAVAPALINVPFDPASDEEAADQLGYVTSAPLMQYEARLRDRLLSRVSVGEDGICLPEFLVASSDDVESRETDEDHARIVGGVSAEGVPLVEGMTAARKSSGPGTRSGFVRISSCSKFAVEQWSGHHEQQLQPSPPATPPSEMLVGSSAEMSHRSTVENGTAYDDGGIKIAAHPPPGQSHFFQPATAVAKQPAAPEPASEAVSAQTTAAEPSSLAAAVASAPPISACLGKSSHTVVDVRRHQEFSQSSQETTPHVLTTASGYVPIVQGIFNGQPLVAALCAPAEPLVATSPGQGQQQQQQAEGQSSLVRLSEHLQKLGMSGGADSGLSDLLQEAMDASGPGAQVQLKMDSHTHRQSKTTVYESNMPLPPGRSPTHEAVLEMQGALLKSLRETTDLLSGGKKREGQPKTPPPSPQPPFGEPVNTSQQRESMEEGYIDEHGNVVVSKKVTRVVTTTRTTVEGEAVDPKVETIRTVELESQAQGDTAAAAAASAVDADLWTVPDATDGSQSDAADLSQPSHRDASPSPSPSLSDRVPEYSYTREIILEKHPPPGHTPPATSPVDESGLSPRASEETSPLEELYPHLKSAVTKLDTSPQKIPVGMSPTEDVSLPEVTSEEEREEAEQQPLPSVRSRIQQFEQLSTTHTPQVTDSAADSDHKGQALAEAGQAVAVTQLRDSTVVDTDVERKDSRVDMTEILEETIDTELPTPAVHMGRLDDYRTREAEDLPHGTPTTTAHRVETVAETYDATYQTEQYGDAADQRAEERSTRDDLDASADSGSSAIRSSKTDDADDWPATTMASEIPMTDEYQSETYEIDSRFEELAEEDLSIETDSADIPAAPVSKPENPASEHMGEVEQAHFDVESTEDSAMLQGDESMAMSEERKIEEALTPEEEWYQHQIITEIADHGIAADERADFHSETSDKVSEQSGDASLDYSKSSEGDEPRTEVLSEAGNVPSESQLEISVSELSKYELSLTGNVESHEDIEDETEQGGHKDSAPTDYRASEDVEPHSHEPVQASQELWYQQGIITDAERTQLTPDKHVFEPEDTALPSDASVEATVSKFESADVSVTGHIESHDDNQLDQDRELKDEWAPRIADSKDAGIGYVEDDGHASPEVTHLQTSEAIWYQHGELDHSSDAEVSQDMMTDVPTAKLDAETTAVEMAPVAAHASALASICSDASHKHDDLPEAHELDGSEPSVSEHREPDDTDNIKEAEEPHHKSVSQKAKGAAKAIGTAAAAPFALVGMGAKSLFGKKKHKEEKAAVADAHGLHSKVSDSVMQSEEQLQQTHSDEGPRRQTEASEDKYQHGYDEAATVPEAVCITDTESTSEVTHIWLSQELWYQHGVLGDETDTEITHGIDTELRIVEDMPSTTMHAEAAGQITESTADKEQQEAPAASEPGVSLDELHTEIPGATSGLAYDTVAQHTEEAAYRVDEDSTETPKPDEPDSQPWYSEELSEKHAHAPIADLGTAHHDAAILSPEVDGGVSPDIEADTVGEAVPASISSSEEESIERDITMELALGAQEDVPEVQDDVPEVHAPDELMQESEGLLYQHGIISRAADTQASPDFEPQADLPYPSVDTSVLQLETTDESRTGHVEHQDDTEIESTHQPKDYHTSMMHDVKEDGTAAPTPEVAHIQSAEELWYQYGKLAHATDAGVSPDIEEDTVGEAIPASISGSEEDITLEIESGAQDGVPEVQDDVPEVHAPDELMQESEGLLYQHGIISRAADTQASPDFEPQADLPDPSVDTSVLHFETMDESGISHAESYDETEIDSDHEPKDDHPPRMDDAKEDGIAVTTPEVSQLQSAEELWYQHGALAHASDAQDSSDIAIIPASRSDSDQEIVERDITTEHVLVADDMHDLAEAHALAATEPSVGQHEDIDEVHDRKDEDSHHKSVSQKAKGAAKAIGTAAAAPFALFGMGAKSLFGKKKHTEDESEEPADSHEIHSEVREVTETAIRTEEQPEETISTAHTDAGTTKAEVESLAELPAIDPEQAADAVSHERQPHAAQLEESSLLQSEDEVGDVLSLTPEERWYQSGAIAWPEHEIHGESIAATDAFPEDEPYKPDSDVQKKFDDSTDVPSSDVHTSAKLSDAPEHIKEEVIDEDDYQMQQGETVTLVTSEEQWYQQYALPKSADAEESGETEHYPDDAAIDFTSEPADTVPEETDELPHMPEVEPVTAQEHDMEPTMLSQADVGPDREDKHFGSDPNALSLTLDNSDNVHGSIEEPLSPDELWYQHGKLAHATDAGVSPDIEAGTVGEDTPPSMSGAEEVSIERDITLELALDAQDMHDLPGVYAPDESVQGSEGIWYQHGIIYDGADTQASPDVEPHTAKPDPAVDTSAHHHKTMDESGTGHAESYDETEIDSDHEPKDDHPPRMDDAKDDGTAVTTPEVSQLESAEELWYQHGALPHASDAQDSHEIAIVPASKSDSDNEIVERDITTEHVLVAYDMHDLPEAHALAATEPSVGQHEDIDEVHDRKDEDSHHKSVSQKAKGAAKAIGTAAAAPFALVGMGAMSLFGKKKHKEDESEEPADSHEIHSEISEVTETAVRTEEQPEETISTAHTDTGAHTQWQPEENAVTETKAEVESLAELPAIDPEQAADAVSHERQPHAAQLEESSLLQSEDAVGDVLILTPEEQWYQSGAIAEPKQEIHGETIAVESLAELPAIDPEQAAADAVSHERQPHAAQLEESSLLQSEDEVGDVLILTPEEQWYQSGATAEPEQEIHGESIAATDAFPEDERYKPDSDVLKKFDDSTDVLSSDVHTSAKLSDAPEHIKEEVIDEDDYQMQQGETVTLVTSEEQWYQQHALPKSTDAEEPGETDHYPDDAAIDSASEPADTVPEETDELLHTQDSGFQKDEAAVSDTASVPVSHDEVEPATAQEHDMEPTMLSQADVGPNKEDKHFVSDPNALALTLDKSDNSHGSIEEPLSPEERWYQHMKVEDAVQYRGADAFAREEQHADQIGSDSGKSDGEVSDLQLQDDELEQESAADEHISADVEPQPQHDEATSLLKGDDALEETTRDEDTTNFEQQIDVTSSAKEIVLEADASQLDSVTPAPAAADLSPEELWYQQAVMGRGMSDQDVSSTQDFQEVRQGLSYEKEEPLTESSPFPVETKEEFETEDSDETAADPASEKSQRVSKAAKTAAMTVGAVAAAPFALVGLGAKALADKLSKKKESSEYEKSALDDTQGQSLEYSKPYAEYHDEATHETELKSTYEELRHTESHESYGTERHTDQEQHSVYEGDTEHAKPASYDSDVARVIDAELQPESELSEVDEHAQERSDSIDPDQVVPSHEPLTPEELWYQREVIAEAYIESSTFEGKDTIPPAGTPAETLPDDGFVHIGAELHETGVTTETAHEESTVSHSDEFVSEQHSDHETDAAGGILETEPEQVAPATEELWYQHEIMAEAVIESSLSEHQESSDPADSAGILERQGSLSHEPDGRHETEHEDLVSTGSPVAVSFSEPADVTDKEKPSDHYAIVASVTTDGDDLETDIVEPDQVAPAAEATTPEELWYQHEVLPQVDIDCSHLETDETFAIQPISADKLEQDNASDAGSPPVQQTPLRHPSNLTLGESEPPSTDGSLSVDIVVIPSTPTFIRKDMYEDDESSSSDGAFDDQSGHDEAAVAVQPVSREDEQVEHALDGTVESTLERAEYEEDSEEQSQVTTEPASTIPTTTDDKEEVDDVSPTAPAAELAGAAIDVVQSEAVETERKEGSFDRFDWTSPQPVAEQTVSGQDDDGGQSLPSDTRYSEDDFDSDTHKSEADDQDLEESSKLLHTAEQPEPHTIADMDLTPVGGYEGEPLTHETCDDHADHPESSTFGSKLARVAKGAAMAVGAVAAAPAVIVGKGASMAVSAYKDRQQSQEYEHVGSGDEIDDDRSVELTVELPTDGSGGNELPCQDVTTQEVRMISSTDSDYELKDSTELAGEHASSTDAVIESDEITSASDVTGERMLSPQRLSIAEEPEDYEDDENENVVERPDIPDEQPLTEDTEAEADEALQQMTFEVSPMQLPSPGFEVADQLASQGVEQEEVVPDQSAPKRSIGEATEIGVAAAAAVEDKHEDYSSVQEVVTEVLMRSQSPDSMKEDEIPIFVASIIEEADGIMIAEQRESFQAWDAATEQDNDCIEESEPIPPEIYVAVESHDEDEHSDHSDGEASDHSDSAELRRSSAGGAALSDATSSTSFHTAEDAPSTETGTYDTCATSQDTYETACSTQDSEYSTATTGGDIFTPSSRMSDISISDARISDTETLTGAGGVDTDTDEPSSYMFSRDAMRFMHMPSAQQQPDDVTPTQPGHSLQEQLDGDQAESDSTGTPSISIQQHLFESPVQSDRMFTAQADEVEEYDHLAHGDIDDPAEFATELEEILEVSESSKGASPDKMRSPSDEAIPQIAIDEGEVEIDSDDVELHTGKSVDDDDSDFHTSPSGVLLPPEEDPDRPVSPIPPGWDTERSDRGMHMEIYADSPVPEIVGMPSSLEKLASVDSEKHVGSSDYEQFKPITSQDTDPFIAQRDESSVHHEGGATTTGKADADKLDDQDVLPLHELASEADDDQSEAGGMSTGKKIALGVGAVVGALALGPAAVAYAGATAASSAATAVSSAGFGQAAAAAAAAVGAAIYKTSATEETDQDTLDADSEVAAATSQHAESKEVSSPRGLTEMRIDLKASSESIEAGSVKSSESGRSAGAGKRYSTSRHSSMSSQKSSHEECPVYSDRISPELKVSWSPTEPSPPQAASTEELPTADTDSRTYGQEEREATEADVPELHHLSAEDESSDHADVDTHAAVMSPDSFNASYPEDLPLDSGPHLEPGDLETVQEEPEFAGSLSDIISGNGNGAQGSTAGDTMSMIAQYKRGLKSVSSDNVSESSLQEFERIEREVAIRGDASLSSSEVELIVANLKRRGSEGSSNSLNEFERLETELEHQTESGGEGSDNGVQAADVMLLSDIREESEPEDMSIRDDDEEIDNDVITQAREFDDLFDNNASISVTETINMDDEQQERSATPTDYEEVTQSAPVHLAQRYACQLLRTDDSGIETAPRGEGTSGVSGATGSDEGHISESDSLNDGFEHIGLDSVPAEDKLSDIAHESDTEVVPEPAHTGLLAAADPIAARMQHSTDSLEPESHPAVELSASLADKDSLEDIGAALEQTDQTDHDSLHGFEIVDHSDAPIESLPEGGGDETRPSHSEVTHDSLENLSDAPVQSHVMSAAQQFLITSTASADSAENDSMLEGASSQEAGLLSQDGRGLLSGDTVETYQEYGFRPDDEEKDSLTGDLEEVLHGAPGVAEAGTPVLESASLPGDGTNGNVLSFCMGSADHGSGTETTSHTAEAYPYTLTTYQTSTSRDDGSYEVITRTVTTRVTDPICSEVRFTGSESAQRVRDYIECLQLGDEQEYETVDSQGNVTKTAVQCLDGEHARRMSGFEHSSAEAALSEAVEPSAPDDGSALFVEVQSLHAAGDGTTHL